MYTTWLVNLANTCPWYFCRLERQQATTKLATGQFWCKKSASEQVGGILGPLSTYGTGPRDPICTGGPVDSLSL